MVVDDSDTHRVHLLFKLLFGSNSFRCSEVQDWLNVNVARVVVLEDHTSLDGVVGIGESLRTKKTARSRHNEVIHRDSFAREAHVVRERLVCRRRRTSKRRVILEAYSFGSTTLALGLRKSTRPTDDWVLHKVEVGSGLDELSPTKRTSLEHSLY